MAKLKEMWVVWPYYLYILSLELLHSQLDAVYPVVLCRESHQKIFIKQLFISYKNLVASTGFGWNKGRHTAVHFILV